MDNIVNDVAELCANSVIAVVDKGATQEEFTQILQGGAVEIANKHEIPPAIVLVLIFTLIEKFLS